MKLSRYSRTEFVYGVYSELVNNHHLLFPVLRLQMFLFDLLLPEEAQSFGLVTAVLFMKFPLFFYHLWRADVSPTTELA